MIKDVKRIVEGLRFCAYEAACTGCMADDFCCGEDDIKNRAADLIEQLAAELEQVRRKRDDTVDHTGRLIEKLYAEYERMKRERDAAVRDLREQNACNHCKHWNVTCDVEGDDEGLLMCESCHKNCACKECHDHSRWEWRGFCAENGGAEDGKEKRTAETHQIP